MRVRCALGSVVVCAFGARAQAQAPSPSPSISAPPAIATSPSPTAAPGWRAQSPTPPPSPIPAASPAATPATPPAALPIDQIHSRERMALLSLSTVVMAQKTYAAMNQSLYDSMTCLMRPAQCIPGITDAAPVLDPGYRWLEPRLGYVLRFHPGPAATAEEIGRSKASPSSIKSFAVTLTPQYPGRTGGRAFCGDSAGQMCVTGGAPPPVRDGRCEPCKKLQ